MRYIVYRKCNDVDYELAILNRKSKRKVIHINNFKCWIPQSTQVYRIVVATDEEEESEAKLKLKGAELGEGRRRELEAILEELKDVLDDKPGCNFSAQHVINTGEAKLIRSLPYRLCPAWRQQVQDGALILTHSSCEEGWVA